MLPDLDEGFLAIAAAYAQQAKDAGNAELAGMLCISSWHLQPAPCYVTRDWTTLSAETVNTLNAGQPSASATDLCKTEHVIDMHRKQLHRQPL